MLHFTVQLHSHCSFLWWWHMYFSYTNLLISRLTWNWNWENLVDINNINLLPKICKKFVFVLETVYWKILTFKHIVISRSPLTFKIYWITIDLENILRISRLPLSLRTYWEFWDHNCPWKYIKNFRITIDLESI